MRADEIKWTELCRPVTRGVATGWTGVDMSTPLLPEVVPEIDANLVGFYSGEGRLGGRSWGSASGPVIGSGTARSPCVSAPHFLTWRRPCR